MNAVSLKILALVLLLIATSAHSKEKSADCIDCIKSTADMLPNKRPVVELKNAVARPIALASGSSLVIAASRAPAVKKVSSKESYQGGYCMKYEQAESDIELELLLEEMEAGPYASSMKEFLSTPACNAMLKTDSQVPMIFNTANNAPKNVNFPQVVHDFFVIDKKDPETWLKMINTKSTDGFTFLDFLHYNLERGHYNSYQPSKDAALRILNYVCKNGGVYSHYKATAKCP